MLGKTLAKIDWFYPILAVVLIALSALGLFTLNSIFKGVNTASEFDPQVANTKIKIDGDNLNKAYSAVFDKQILRLEFTQ